MKQEKDNNCEAYKITILFESENHELAVDLHSVIEEKISEYLDNIEIGKIEIGASVLTPLDEDEDESET